MPRKGRGGSRSGTPGTAYANRTDLNTPNVTVPGQEYGKQAAQARAQSIVPMGASPVSTAPAQPAGFGQALAQATPRSPVAPGSLPWTSAPTERPEEPVQTGLPSGPGAGPEALGAGVMPLTRTLAGMAALPTVTQGVLDLAAAARSLGL